MAPGTKAPGCVAGRLPIGISTPLIVEGYPMGTNFFQIQVSLNLQSCGCFHTHTYAPFPLHTLSAESVYSTGA